MRYRIDMEILALSAKIEGVHIFEDRVMALHVLSGMRIGLIQSGLYGINLEIVECE